MGELALTGGRMDSQLSDHHDDARRAMREIHNRMPVILRPETWPAWLGQEPADALGLKGMSGHTPSEEMTRWPLSQRDQQCQGQ